MLSACQHNSSRGCRLERKNQGGWTRRAVSPACCSLLFRGVCHHLGHAFKLLLPCYWYRRQVRCFIFRDAIVVTKPTAKPLCIIFLGVAKPKVGIFLGVCAKAGVGRLLFDGKPSKTEVTSVMFRINSFS